ncbi:MAG: hypothetical protein PHT60_14990 [Acidiphilium sp.]|nr:hypothetical protein [Acidiphilium sp.]MDD4937068.1 hypothetical protein [Acidiphilium sp.]
MTSQQNDDSITRFFNGVADMMIGFDQLAAGSFRGGLVFGGVTVLAKVVSLSVFNVPFADISRSGSIRTILTMVGAGMIVGVVRVVHGWRNMLGPVAVASGAGFIHSGDARPVMSSPSKDG